MQNKHSAIEQTVDGYETTVSATYATKTEVENRETGITETITDIKNKQSAMEQTVDGFETTVIAAKVTSNSALDKATTDQQTAE